MNSSCNIPKLAIAPQPAKQEASGGARTPAHRSFLFLVRKFADHASAGGERIENRVSPPGGKNRSDLLVDVLVCLREKARKLTLGRRSELFYGDEEADLAGFQRFFEREMVEQSELFGNVFLGKFPIAHKFLRREKLPCTGTRAMQRGEC